MRPRKINEELSGFEYLIDKGADIIRPYDSNIRLKIGAQNHAPLRQHINFVFNFKRRVGANNDSPY